MKNVESLFRAELARRKLTVNKNQVIGKEIRIGATECSVYASSGLPSDVNRTVGAWGVHKQLVFGRAYRSYIYIQNGRVSSFQD